MNLDPRAVARWGHAGRLALASAIFVAAVWAWDRATPADTRVAALAFALTVVATGAAMWRTELRPTGPARPWGMALAAALAAFDLALVTAAVHVTGGAASQFAPLYVLAIAGAALALPFGGAVAAALAGCGLYAAEVLWWRPVPDAGATAALWLQLAVFGLVAVAAGWLGARLRTAGAGSAALARALARARIEAADVLGNMTSGVVTVDAAGRLLYVNAAADALLAPALGHSLRAHLGRPVLDLVATAAPGVAVALDRAARDGERTTRAESAVARPDDRGVTGEGTLGVTTTLGASASGARTATAVFSDITASKRLEVLHRRAERLEAVAELAASLAHEIRNPLASIRSAVEQLVRLTAAAERAALGGESAEDARALAGLTMRESDRLSRLLGEFLDFSRARVTQMARVDVGEVAREAARLAAAHPDTAGVRMAVDVVASASPHASLAVDGDAELLHQALFNLVLNAAQATAAHRSGGGVRVRVRPADAGEVSGAARGGVAVEVADDGAGVAPELVGRLFEPFVTGRAGGSGLGLAVVQRAVEAHGGGVLVDAGGGGEGARFTCVLPATGGAGGFTVSG